MMSENTQQPGSQPSFNVNEMSGTDAVAANKVKENENGSDGEPSLDASDYNTWRLILSLPMTRTKTKALIRELLSGLTVSLAQVPEAVAFSFTAGVPPIVGLQAAWMIGLITALFGGAPGMVSGATGALAVVLPDFVEEYGLGYLFITVLFMGIMQVVFGALGGGKLVKFIGHPIMLGFCNGLAIVICIAQFHSFKVPMYSPVPCNATDFTTSNLESSESNSHPYKCEQWATGATAGFQALEVVLTMAVIFFLPKLTRAIPSSLAGIVVGTVVEFALVRPLGFETPTVGDIAVVKGTFPIPVWLDDEYKNSIPSLASAETYKVCLPISATMAIIGLVESLMTLQLVGEITGKKPSPKAEAIAQGAANIVTGIFGGMGGCAMIGQSMINVKSGGVTRISTAFAAAFLLVIILAAYPLINLVPMASLAGVMFMVVIGTFEWHSIGIVISSFLPEKVRTNPHLKWIRKIKRTDALIIVLVTVVAVVANLAVAVGLGIVVATLVFAWDQEAQLNVAEIDESRPLKDTEVDEENLSINERDGQVDIASVDSGLPEGIDPRKVKVYQVRGPLFFASSQKFMSLFHPESDPDCVILYLDQAVLSDYSALVAINQVARKYHACEKVLLLRKVQDSDMKVVRKAHHLLYVYDKEKADDLNETELLSMQLAPRWQGEDIPLHVDKHHGAHSRPDPVELKVVSDVSDARDSSTVSNI